jgi:hypothetical protein
MHTHSHPVSWQVTGLAVALSLLPFGASTFPRILDGATELRWFVGTVSAICVCALLLWRRRPYIWKAVAPAFFIPLGIAIGTLLLPLSRLTNGLGTALLIAPILVYLARRHGLLALLFVVGALSWSLVLMELPTLQEWVGNYGRPSSIPIVLLTPVIPLVLCPLLMLRARTDVARLLSSIIPMLLVLGTGAYWSYTRLVPDPTLQLVLPLWVSRTQYELVVIALLLLVAAYLAYRARPAMKHIAYSR